MKPIINLSTRNEMHYYDIGCVRYASVVYAQFSSEKILRAYSRSELTILPSIMR